MNISNARILLDEKKYHELRDFLCSEEPQDVALLLEQFPKEELPLMFRILHKDFATEVFVEMDPELQKALIEAFTDNELEAILDDLYMDDTVDLIEEMPANVVKRILAHSDPDSRRQINQLLKYPDDSAGTIMTTEFVDLKTHMTVGDAFKQIRRTGVEKETIYTCYVTDEKRVLIGVISVKDLLLSEEETPISEIMEDSPLSVNTDDDKEDVMKAIAKYDLLAMPVVDKEARLVGIVTIDDAVDVLQDENTEDIEKMAAITPSEKPYLKTNVFETWWQRIPWLLLLMVSATFTSRILTHFEDKLSAMPIMMAFIPQLMDTGGNAGSQASVSIIRGLSLGDIEMKDFFRVLWKEIRVSVLIGLTLAVVNFGKMFIFNDVNRSVYGLGKSLIISAVVCLTIAVAVVIAKVVGCILPMLAKRIGFDPAVMASPFITTIVDVMSLLIYFRIATTVFTFFGISV